jgi:ATP-binding cassette subfamily B (MDR/TAP) protein 1
LQERYLQAVLCQDIVFFDNVGAGEVAIRIQTDTCEFGCNVYNLLDCIYICRSRPARHLWESCYGNKLSFSIRNRYTYVFWVSFVVSKISWSLGYILAYIRSWRLALAMTSILPCVVAVGGVMNKFISRYMQMSRCYEPVEI